MLLTSIPSVTLVSRAEAAPQLGYTAATLGAVMSRNADAWPAPIACRLKTRALQYDLDAMLATAQGDETPLSRKPATVTGATGLITCLECGIDMRSLGRHLVAKHEMNSAEYREKYGMPRTAALEAPGTRRRRVRTARADLQARLDTLAPYQSAGHLAELQVKGVENLRDSTANRAVVKQHRAPVQRKGVAAMREARAKIFEAKIIEAGYTSLEDAIRQTAHLSGSGAAKRIGIGATSVRRWRQRLL
ncbi:MucR family transcriptional regulator [Leucobacter aridicollis]|uniref:MucR family transcriptional regulator n=1 Tax=Leucobacter aridicollis TaxID=283878 RepID=UPI002107E57D|nr:MucR family transcriptional regulator [Leucobacter aridicollis]UTX53274.1 MucR family transcriptional regulator [Leucobacter aridicollis]